MFGRTREEPSAQARVAGTSQTVTDAPIAAEQKEEKGPREGVILLLFTILTLAAVTFVLVNEENDALNDPVEKAARGEINGLDDLSMLREERLSRVLDDIADRSRPLVSSMRVDPERVNATVRDEDGIRKVLNIDGNFKIDESDFGAGEDEAINADDLDPGAPERMIRTVSERTGQSPEDVDYVALSVSSLGISWSAYLDKGPARNRQWTSDENGRDVRKPGEPSAEQRRREKCFEGADDAEALARCSERFPA